jgi:hypothetical protein
MFVHFKMSNNQMDKSLQDTVDYVTSSSRPSSSLVVTLETEKIAYMMRQWLIVDRLAEVRVHKRTGCLTTQTGF